MYWRMLLMTLAGVALGVLISLKLVAAGVVSTAGRTADRLAAVEKRLDQVDVYAEKDFNKLSERITTLENNSVAGGPSWWCETKGGVCGRTRDSCERGGELKLSTPMVTCSEAHLAYCGFSRGLAFCTRALVNCERVTDATHPCVGVL